MMDNSQSSDCFPESADTFNTSLVHMDTLSYESLVTNTKQALYAAGSTELQKSSFHKHFISLLKECSTCINQSLELVTGLLAESEVCITKLTGYLSDAVSLLQLLSGFIKNVVESVSVACCSMKMFPATTGHIVFTVFSHCKDSESLYGTNLSSVEKQLMDLFRNCHQLQLIYLMILEKHFIFDMAVQEEKDILIEALHINLKIGEIVHSLDVKTMAEQWKAYTMICEKYCSSLLDTDIFQDCTQVLCMLIKNNIKTAIENNQDEKTVTRSLKVTSFTIKILLKLCNTFKLAMRKDYSSLLDVVFFMQRSSVSNLELTAEKSQFKNLINVSIVIPSECLLKELLSDETFCSSLFSRDEETIKNDISLGFVLTIISAMRCLTQGYKCKTVTKYNLIQCVYRMLPSCHNWLKHDTELRIDSDQVPSHGLFEHLLIHTAALALTLNAEEFVILERNMTETILGTDCYSALFSSNLWAIIARHVTPQLLFNELVWLCTMYKKLENHKMFQRSPQKVHLSCTIGRLFELMPVEDKMKICKQFRIHDDDHVCLWTALGVKNLPDEVRISAEDVVAEKLKTQLQWFNGKDGEGIVKLVQVISLAATCTFTNARGIEDCVMKAWSKTCPKHNFAIQHVDRNTVWFYDYVEALVALTESVWHRLCERNVHLIKLLHWISGLIQQSNTEFKLILTKTLCKLASSDICGNKLADANLTLTFSCLFQQSEDIVQNMLTVTLRKYRHDKNLDRILSNIEDYSLQESWSKIKEDINYGDEKYKLTVPFKYSHKCLENKSDNKLNSFSVSELKKTSSSNFDFADVEDFFDSNSDYSEPLCKKVKLNANAAEDIIKRLETDASLLCKVKENVITAEYKNRIRNVCEKLRNIIH